MTLQEPIRRQPLISLLVAHYLSAFGNAITVVTIPLYVLSQTGSPLATGAAGFAGALPLIFAGAIGGVWIDRLGGHRMSILSDVAAGILIGLVPLLDQSFGLPMPVLLLLLFGRSVVATPAAAARMSILKPWVEAAGARLETMNSVFQAAPRLGLMLGAPAAAVLISVYSPVAGLWVDAAAFLVGAALMALVPGSRPVRTPGQQASFVKQLGEGAALIRTLPVVTAMTAFVFVTNFLDNAFTPLILPIYASEVLDDGSKLSWLVAATGVGAIAGTFLYAPLSRRLLANRRYTLLGCFLVIALLRLSMGLLPSMVPMVIISLLIGLAAGPLNPLLTTVMLDRVPEQMRGRVFGLSGAVAMSAAPLGILLAGWLVDHFGVRFTAVCFGLAYLLLLAVSLRSRALRDMEAVSSDSGKVPVNA